MSIDPLIWQRMRKIQGTKFGRRLARNPTNLIEKVLIAFILKHDSEYEQYQSKLQAIEKELFTVEDDKVKGATEGDLD